MKAISHSILLFVLLFTPLRAVYALQTGVPVEFRNYAVINGFPNSLTFNIEICNAPENALVYLYYKIAQSSWTFSNDKVFSDGLTEEGCQRRRTSILTKDEPPMLDIQYYWLVRVKGGESKSLQQEYLYEDPRFEWHVLQNKDVIVHWHDQPEEFGKKVFDIATRSIQQQRDLYGTDLQYPAQIVIENTDEEFMSWQFMPNPDTGGLALPWYGMTIQVVEDSSEDWLNEVLPHEISHLYFFQVTINGDAWPALWLDEGLAVYYEFGEHQFEDQLVRSAVLQDRLIPLLSLREGFGADDQDVDLAYAESYYVAVYILEVHGKEKLAQLLQEYNHDKELDEAFMSAFGQSLGQFEQDWENWVKAKFKVDIPATVTPLPQEQSPASYPGRNVLAIIALLCCFSVAGATGLGLVILPLKATAKKTVS
jgi:hypothetical protein